MLLKSWATPPANRPMDSIFCAWRSCSSSWRNSVMSWTMEWITGLPSSSMALLYTATSRMEPSARRWRNSK